MSRNKNKPRPPIVDTTDAMRPTGDPAAETTAAPRPPAPPQVAIVIRCPACRGREIDCDGTKDQRVRYYRCLRCVTDGDWTRWKVPISDPLAP